LEGAVRTQSELEAVLRSLNWELEGPTRTVKGWKAAIRRGNFWYLKTNSTVEEVLEDLLQLAQKHETDPT
jgi:hypothetical protein